MKKVYLLGIFLALASFAQAQVPQKMSYQAVIRDKNGVLLKNTKVGYRISLLKGTPSDTSVYTETHTPTTNENGLVSIEVGNGTVTKGSFSAIDWSMGPYYIKTETDLGGGNNYTLSGTSQLMSVPYALFAGSVKNATPKHKVGDVYGGGVVFYTYDDGEHGLIASPEDLNKHMRWNNDTAFSLTYTRSDGVNAGKLNTILLIAMLGKGDGDYYAARLCSEYSSTLNGIKYGDWYLPSKHELNLLFLNKSVILNLEPGVYWSSTEDSEDTAWAQDMSTGTQYAATKHYTQNIRAVRAF